MAYHVNDDIPTKITMVHRDSCKELRSEPSCRRMESGTNISTRRMKR